MIYLVLNILFGSAFVLGIKWVQNRSREDIITIGMINYIAATLFSLPQWFRESSARAGWEAILAGGTMGVTYFVLFFIVVWAIRWMGVASSTVVGILSILVPIWAGVFVWGESPNAYQSVGIVLALISLLLIGRAVDAAESETLRVEPENGRAAGPDPRGQDLPRWIIGGLLVAYFVLAGMNRLSQEAFRHVCIAEERSTFLFVGFGVAAILASVVLVVRRRPIDRYELAIGTGLGAANILQGDFALQALKVFDGFIVFPIASAGSLILITLVATRILNERLHARTYAGIALACVALLLLNYS